MNNETQVLDPAVVDPAVMDPAVIEPAPTETQNPVVEEPLDPITGLEPQQGGSPNTSNGNQVAVNSTFDYSVNTFTMYNYSSTQTQESMTNQVGQPGNELLAIGGGDDFSCGVSSSRIGRIYRFDSRQYFRGGRRKARVDRIINFSSEAGDGVELSRRVFKGIGDLDFTTVANKRGSKRAARTDTDLIYEQSSGRLYFNANDDGKKFGNKGGLFAIFESSPLMSSSDFTIV